MATQQWDAIVIGAGQGGLTCAAYLAASGLRVLALEQHNIAGGNSQVFRRRGRYEFDVGAHYIGGCGPDGPVTRIYEGLGLAGRVTFREIDPDGFDRIVLPTTSVRVPRTWEAYRERVAAALPEEAAGIRRFLDECAAMHADQLRAWSNPDDASTFTSLGGNRRLSTAGGMMREAGLSSRARTVLAAQVANYGVAPDEVAIGAHVAMIGDYLNGAYYPKGGGQMLGAALVEALEGHGGELRTRSLVTRIIVEHGRVAGVRLADGEVLRAPVVVSNADYLRTVLDLVGAEYLPASTVARARRTAMSLPLVVLYLALAPDAVEPQEANLWWHETEDIDQVLAGLGSGELREPAFAFICPRPKLGGSHPYHAIEVMTLCPASFAPWGADDAGALSHAYRISERYRAERERFDRALFALAERALGPLAGKVLHRELATPLTHARFARSSGGTPYGIAPNPRQFGLLRPGHETALPGLYLAGASTRSGFGIAAVTTGGVRCAEAVLGRPLLADVYAGKVIGDPARLPDRHPDWDPLLACRGSRATSHPARSWGRASQ